MNDYLILVCSILNYLNLESGDMQKQHLLLLLAGIVQWMEPPDAVSHAIKLGKSDRYIFQ